MSTANPVNGNGQAQPVKPQSQQQQNGPAAAPTIEELHEQDEQQTPLPKEDRSHLVDPKSGERLTEPVTKTQAEHQIFLVAIDPDGAKALSDKAVKMAERLAKPDDTVILLEVLPPVLISDPAAYALGVGYSGLDLEWQRQTLCKLREKHISELKELANNAFPADVKVLVQAVHGGTESKILRVAEGHGCDLIILAKRKLGRWEKLITTSVCNYVSSHAQCAVLIAK